MNNVKNREKLCFFLCLYVLFKRFVKDGCRNYTQETYPQIVNKPYSCNYRRHLMVSTVVAIHQNKEEDVNEDMDNRKVVVNKNNVKA